MYLKKSRIVNSSKRNLDINIEKFDDSLVMIAVTDVDLKAPLCYWRVDPTNIVDIPPLEIGVDYDCCMIKSFTIFIDLNDICYRHIDERNVIQGDVLIDTSPFTKPVDFIDIRQAYHIYESDNKLICWFGEKSNYVDRVDSGVMELYFNSANELIGIALYGISLEQLWNSAYCRM